MTAIPTDIQKAADDAAGFFLRDLRCGISVRFGMASASTRAALQDAIGLAIAAERERCAKVADAYAEVNWQSCTDSILLDPVLSNRGERPLTKADWAKAEDWPSTEPSTPACTTRRQTSPKPSATQPQQEHDHATTPSRFNRC